MSEATPIHSAGEASFITGPLTVGDELVALHEPGLRGVGMDEAVEAFVAGFGENWRDEDITDYGERQWKLGELSMRDAVGPDSEIHDMIRMSAEIEKPDIHAVSDMTEAFVPEIRKMLGFTGLGAEVTHPHDSKLMQLIRVRFPETRMYDTFAMAHGPLIATPRSQGLIIAAEERGHDAHTIGRIIGEPVIRIRSPRLGSGEILSYDV